ncbi:hypothetical protein [Clostridium sp.]|uniref:hypothetical protein n=1 Tax=Clostridium sp. TaxID=1506 RepID=UPI002FCB9AFA
MDENKKFISVILSLLLLLNIWSFSSESSRNKNLQQRVNSLSSEISNLQHQLGNKINEINNSISSMKEAQKWSSNSMYNFTAFDESNNKVNTEISWSLSEIAPGDNIFLSFAPLEPASKVSSDWTEVQAKNIGNLSYSAEINLSPDKNYKLKVHSESSMGSRGEDLLDISFKELTENRFSIIPGMGTSKGPRYEHHMYLLNMYNGTEILKVKSATAKVYVNGALENTITLHKATDKSIKEEFFGMYNFNEESDIWFNDDVIWVKGEENWVQGKDGSWTLKGEVPKFGSDDVRIEITIIDNMDKTYTETFPKGQ